MDRGMLDLFKPVCLLVLLCLTVTNSQGAVKIDLNDIAILAGYWLSEECDISNDFCEGADIDHYNDKDYDGYTVDLDCDDTDPNIWPGRTDDFDGKDNDCDGTTDEDEPLMRIIITEIMYDSSGYPDEHYEWFEVFNYSSTTPANLRGWTVRDQAGPDQQVITINDDLIIEPRGYAVLCSNSASAVSSGVQCDYEYGYMILNNTADEIILEFCGLQDEVWYAEGAGGWPIATSGSLNLDPDAYLSSIEGNEDPANWCNSPEGWEIPNGDEATPGSQNADCF